MSLPTVTKTWDFHGINQRISVATYNSVLLIAAQCQYLIKNYLCTYGAGWSVHWSCDGTTGPSSSSDHTDRWTSDAATQVQTSSTSAAMSWVVLDEPNGGQLLISYNGSSNSIFRVGWSPSAGYTLAGTSTWQPVLPADECLVANSDSMVSASASNDNILHIMTPSDGTSVRWWVYSASTCQRFCFFELISSTVTAMTWTPPVITGNWGATSHDSAWVNGAFTSPNRANVRISATTLTNIYGGGEGYNLDSNATGVCSNAAPELQGAAPIVGLCWACSATNFRGKLGNRVDVWYPYSAGLGDAATAGSLQFCYLNGHLVPWDGASTPLIA